jgi:hypothetical protein
MGTNFFAMNPSTHSIVVSSQFWIYFCISLPMTALTMWLSRRNMLQAIFGKGKKQSNVDEERFCGNEKVA